KLELLTALIVASLVFLYQVHHRRYPSRNEYHQHYVDIVQFLSKLFDTTFLSSQSQDHLKDAQFFLLFVLDLSTYSYLPDFYTSCSSYYFASLILLHALISTYLATTPI